MKKTNILLGLTAAIALAAASSLPAAANSAAEDFFASDEPPTSVPEPTSVFGLMALAGGTVLAKKRADDKKSKE